MDRADRSGFAIAIVGHVALFAALSYGLLNAPKLDLITADPIEVELVEEVALTSTAPDPVADAPAPAPAPAASEPEPMAMPEPSPPLPTPKPASQPQTRPAPTPKPARAQPQPQAKPAARPQPQQRTQTAQRSSDTRDRRRPDRERTGLSRDLVSGLSDAPTARPNARPATTPGRGTTNGTPVAAIGPAVTASLGAEVRRQLKPHWKAPTGADVELLRTTVAVRLNKDGSLAGAPTVVQQTGINDSNRAQARLHADQAIKAVRLAAPFQLPSQFYDAWQEIRPTFDRRLSQ